jgi:hypothetical protein
MKHPSKSLHKGLRYTLGTLLLLVAVNALGGGYYGMAGAKDVPTEWLQGSPFRNYFIPGIILFLVVGGSSFIAAVAVFRRHRIAFKAAFTCAMIIVVWLSGQITIIGYVSWMQPATAVASLLILILTWVLSKFPEG